MRVLGPLVAGLLAAGLLGPLSAATQHPEEPAVRAPLPSPEAIAALPPDGGEEFNRLVHEKSPYLLQHARNPVDWYPWGDEAFERAAREDKPVFLSIGYSTCHWCHVMEHESFEDAEVAALMNEHFICIKVDREERPDLDQVYMTVTQQMTGRGGWPMTVLMTPEKKPFFAGTYFPKRGRFGGAGMMELLPRIAEVWEGRRQEVLASAEQVAQALAKMSGSAPGPELGPATLDLAQSQLAERFDAEHGGFGPAPKFPVPHNLRFLLRRARRGDDGALEMAETTLRAMRLGGVWDHVGFGFHRYSTDRVWRLPHFEKMLYDQALLAMAYTEAWQLTGREEYERTAREILTYVQRDMTSPEGAFYSAEDADSEGEEGLFYVWKPEELVEVLGQEDGEFAIELFGVEPGGNFEDQASGKKTGDSILHLRRDLATEAAVRDVDPEALEQRVEGIRERLFAVREKRVHPLKDDKVLTDWNGLMIAAFAHAAQAFGDEEYANAARRAADFLLTHLRTADGRLHKRYRAGEAGLPGMLEDYAFAAWGLVELYETTFEERYLRAAKELTDTALEHFQDDDAGGFFTAPDDGEELIVRAKEIYDGAIPSGNSVVALVLLRLARMTGETGYEEDADRTMRAFSARVAQMPQGHTQLMLALDFAVGPTREIVVAGRRDADDTRAMLRALQRPFLPNDVVLLRPEGEAEAIAKLAPFVAEQHAQDGKATAYVCENFACQAPTTDVTALEAAVGAPGDSESE